MDAILDNCIEKNNCLYDSNESKLASGGLVDNLYYCNQYMQYTGYLGNDVYGTMYFKTYKKGQFIAVSYHC